jgi:hypothetical protein
VLVCHQLIFSLKKLIAMAYNMQNFMMGFILADREKKRMEEKGIEVPKNFTATQGFMFGAIPNPHAASLVLQNEVQKRDSVISPVAQGKIEKAEETINKLGDELKEIIKKASQSGVTLGDLQSEIEVFHKKVVEKDEFPTLKERLLPFSFSTSAPSSSGANAPASGGAATAGTTSTTNTGGTT